MAMALLATLAVSTMTMMAGVADARPPQKIVGGMEAYWGEFPYQVSLRIDGEHACGGAIISKRHIITAAHCVIDEDPADIVIATGTLLSIGGQSHAVRRIVTHWMYNKDDIESPNDIAIITLAVDMTFGENQNKIDLPVEPTPSGVTAVSTGWGNVHARSDDVNLVLKKVNLRTMSPAECQRVFKDHNTIYRNQICTDTSSGSGTCRADSGGPLAYNNRLIGVVSYGIPCATGSPDVFTSVYHHLDWIRENTRETTMLYPIPHIEYNPYRFVYL